MVARSLDTSRLSATMRGAEAGEEREEHEEHEEHAE